MIDFDKMIDDLIDRAIHEDIGDGDHTSLACVPSHSTGGAQLLVKEPCIIAGVHIAHRIFRRIDKELIIKHYIKDGTKVNIGDVVLVVIGKTHSILQAERLILNVMQRMSGIATNTRKYVDRLHGLKTKVLDTRKTTLGNRVLEKMAVRIGGGQNHRFGLYDMILVKDNHIDFAGGIEMAISKVKTYLELLGRTMPVEIEVRNLMELDEVIHCGFVNRIMLDNFSISETKEAVKMIKGRFETESSGGINLNTIRDYALCGVDYISVGGLTHQIKSVDLSLKAL
ncbi:MAG: carboxylating nicotinate-nucleotide diphosphorylase [Bacteroidales bacterium]